MVAALKVLLRTECSPLEAGVEYSVPDNSLLMPLLTQLEGLQALWAAVDRSELISVTFWNALLVHDTHPCFACQIPQNKHGFSTRIDVRSSTRRSKRYQKQQSLIMTDVKHDRQPLILCKVVGL